MRNDFKNFFVRIAHLLFLRPLSGGKGGRLKISLVVLCGYALYGVVRQWPPAHAFDANTGSSFTGCWWCEPLAWVSTERHQLGGWVTATGENFSPLRQAVVLFKDTQGRNLVGYPVSTNAIGGFTTTIDVRCWASRWDPSAYLYSPASVYVEDPFVGEVPAGATYAFLCR